MKKLLVVALMAVSGLIHAQNFPGEDVELLVGKELKVIPQSSKMGYSYFFSDEALRKIYKEKGNYTPHDKVAGKVFKVVSYEPLRNDKYKLTLQNSETGTIYYQYSSKYPLAFKFEVIGGLTYPDGYACKKATKRDASAIGDDVESLEYPEIEGIKVSTLKDGKSMNFFSIYVKYKNMEYQSGMYGLTIELENGQKLNFNETVKEYGQGGNLEKGIGVMVTIPVEDDKSEMLKSNKIVKVTIGGLEMQIKEGIKIQEFIKCATK